MAIDVNTGRFVGARATSRTRCCRRTSRRSRRSCARSACATSAASSSSTSSTWSRSPHREEVFASLESEIKKDRAKTKLLNISEFGLVEITRKRSRANLERLLTQACPYCSGRGRIKSNATICLNLRKELLHLRGRIGRPGAPAARPPRDRARPAAGGAGDPRRAGALARGPHPDPERSRAAPRAFRRRGGLTIRTEPFALPGWTGELAAGLRPADLAAAVRAPDRSRRRPEDPPLGAQLPLRGPDGDRGGSRRGGGQAVPPPHSPRPAEAPAAGEQGREELAGGDTPCSAAGLSTPEPVMRIESAGEAGPSFYVCRYLAGLTEARYLFRAANAGEEAERFPEVDFPAFVAALGRTARRLHDAGFWHRDLSGGNLLLRFGADRLPAEIYLVDLNRTRMGRPPSVSERLRDLSRLAALPARAPGAAAAELLGGPAAGLRRGIYLAYHRGFLWKNESKQRAARRPRPGEAAAPAAAARTPTSRRRPPGAGARDKVVWDHLSDQPHQHAGRLDKLRVRLADARSHGVEAAAVAGALPRIWRRYRELKRGASRGAGRLRGDRRLRPPLAGGPRSACSPWSRSWGRATCCCASTPGRTTTPPRRSWRATLHARGLEVSFALPQNRELVRDPARWRRALEEIAPRFTPYGRRFQVGQAINRSKWGIWNVREYVELARRGRGDPAPHPGVELLGPVGDRLRVPRHRRGAEPARSRLPLRRRLGPALRRPPRGAGEPPGGARHRGQGAAAAGDRRDRPQRAPAAAGSPRSTGRCARGRTRRPAATSRWTRRRRRTTWSATTSWRWARGWSSGSSGGRWWRGGTAWSTPPIRRDPRRRPSFHALKTLVARAGRRPAGGGAGGSAAGPALPLPPSGRRRGGRGLERRGPAGPGRAAAAGGGGDRPGWRGNVRSRGCRGDRWGDRRGISGWPPGPEGHTITHIF